MNTSRLPFNIHVLHVVLAKFELEHHAFSDNVIVFPTNYKELHGAASPGNDVTLSSLLAHGPLLALGCRL